jgi:hypothetical protein
LKSLLDDCAHVKQPMGINKKYYDLMKKDFPKLEFEEGDSQKFWIGLKYQNNKGKPQDRGRVKV